MYLYMLAGTLTHSTPPSLPLLPPSLPHPYHTDNCKIAQTGNLTMDWMGGRGVGGEGGEGREGGEGGRVSRDIGSE